MEWVRSQYIIDALCFWGFSMGAVTALLMQSSNSSHNNNLCADCLVLDSPFSSFQLLAEDLLHERMGAAATFIA